MNNVERKELTCQSNLEANINSQDINITQFYVRIIYNLPQEIPLPIIYRNMKLQILSRLISFIAAS